MTNMSPYLFCSERLGFRQWQDKDLIPFADMCSDPEVMRYFPNTRTFQESEAAVKRYKDHFEEKSYCFYAVDVLADKSFIGFIGFTTPDFDPTYKDSTEIGWRLRKEVWGQGLATEGAVSCIRYGFETFHFPEIIAYTAFINIPSQRVMEKAGMQLVETFDHPKVDDRSPLKKHVLYKITDTVKRSDQERFANLS